MAKMTPKNRFTHEILSIIQKEKILGIRAGRDSTHRVIGIWAVVVDGRVFVRSWSMKPRSWWRTFLEDPHGTIIVGTKEIPVRAIQTRSEHLKDRVSAAYKGEVQHARVCSVREGHVEEEIEGYDYGVGGEPGMNRR